MQTSGISTKRTCGESLEAKKLERLRTITKKVNQLDKLINSSKANPRISTIEACQIMSAAHTLTTLKNLTSIN